MIIKQLPYHGTFEKIIDYIDRGAHDETDLTFFKNIGVSEGNTRDAVLNSFIKNDRYRGLRIKTRGQHVILSLHHLDRENVTPEIIQDLVAKFLETRRYDKCVTYGRVHEEKNIHVHLYVSQNYFLKNKSCDVPKKEYLAQNRAVSEYLEQKYSKELPNSYLYHKPREKERKPFEKTPKGVLKNKLINMLDAVVEQAKNITHLSELIKKKFSDVEIYDRGENKHYGIKYGKLKFRLGTVIRPEQLEVLKRLEQLREIEDRNRDRDDLSPSLTL